jgi:hypothetical protein
MPTEEEKKEIYKNIFTPRETADGCPVYVAVEGRCWPQKDVAEAVLECMEEHIKWIIDHSSKPKSILRRLAQLKGNAKAKALIWTEALKRVMQRTESLTTEEAIAKEKGLCHVVDIAELANNFIK